MGAQNRWAWLHPLLLAASLWAGSSAAAPTAADSRREALKLAGEAMDLLQAGDFAAALEKFSQADELVPAPTLKLRMARCLDKLDRMQEAAETYRAVIATELARGAPAQHYEARKQAVPELAALLEQIPTVTVTVSGKGSADAVVSLAGSPLPPSAVGEKQQLDPGRYVFEARLGDRSAKEDVVLKRGDHKRIVLELPAPIEPVSPPAGPDATPSESSPLWALGWAAIGLGGAGLSVGSILGVVVLGEEDDLLAQCPDRRCLPASHDRARAFDAKRMGSTAGFIVGGVGVAAGITMLLLAPAPGEEGAEATIRPLLGPGGAGIAGSF